MASLAIPIEMVRRFSREDYYRMRDQGLLSRRTELIEGVLVDKITISPKHSYIVTQLRAWLSENLPQAFLIREEKPISIGNSEPEPDISVVRGSMEDYRDAHPTTAEWVIEVAISSLSLDLGKRKIYAQAGIPYYWIIDPEDNRVLVFENPEGEAYTKESIYGKDDDIAIPFVQRKSIRLDWI
ncbi:MAG: Uma2 family endonuclease [Leptospira sp.]|nr:Uma2 family endonuclease [Leptospira sp.]